MNVHRIIRRSTTYGTPYDPDAISPQDDETPRGLYFIFISAKAMATMEFLQQEWINNGNFMSLGEERDPNVGLQEDGATFTIPQEPVRRRIHGIETFNVLRGGEYFFMPSLPALSWLATSATTRRDRAHDGLRLRRADHRFGVRRQRRRAPGRGKGLPGRRDGIRQRWNDEDIPKTQWDLPGFLWFPPTARASWLYRRGPVFYRIRWHDQTKDARILEEVEVRRRSGEAVLIRSCSPRRRIWQASGRAGYGGRQTFRAYFAASQ